MALFRNDTTKLADIMCGDHPSFTSKSELNAREPGDVDKTKPKDKEPQRDAALYDKITTATTRMQSRSPRAAISELTLTRRAPLTSAQQAQVLHAAALDSVRWPPYVLAGWAVLLVAAHTLHGLVDLLERVLPPLRRLCEYMSETATRAWGGVDSGAGRGPWGGACTCAALWGAAAALWTTYGALRAARALTLWAVLPLAEGGGPTGPNVLREAASRLSTPLKR